LPPIERDTSRSDPARLDLRLIAVHPGLSRRKAREVIEKGQVTVDGALAREPGLMVPAAAAIVWDPNRKALPRARLSLDRLYEDDTLLVVDKPAGLLTVPSAPGKEGEDTARDRVFQYVTKLHPRRPYVGVVHRLDRDTSGALAFALTPALREALRAVFRRHALTRRYLAIVRVLAPAGDRGTVELPVHTEYVAGRRRVARPGEPSLAAATRYRVRERLGDCALVELELETGRQHQIRLHLASIGLPVLGDPVYGSEGGRGRSVEAGRQMLHAWLLELTHPETGVVVRAESPLPADFRAALADLRRVPRTSPKPRSTTRRAP
jgi:23S rRNA pseudouridine1911/1915/1917 synthase